MHFCDFFLVIKLRCVSKTYLVFKSSPLWSTDISWFSHFPWLPQNTSFTIFDTFSCKNRWLTVMLNQVTWCFWDMKKLSSIKSFLTESLVMSVIFYMLLKFFDTVFQFKIKFWHHHLFLKFKYVNFLQILFSLSGIQIYSFCYQKTTFLIR